MDEDSSPPYTDLETALGISHNDHQAFILLLSLCDPQFLPPSSQNFIPSLDALSDVFIALLYLQSKPSQPIEISKYSMSVQVFKLLLYIVEFLGPTRDEEFEILGLCCGPDFILKLPCWTPKPPLNESNDTLKLCYLLCCLAVNVLRKLGPENLALNPYMPKFVELWKVYTIIILNCLHIDRELEEMEQESPEIVLEVLKGASLLRYVLGYCLNPPIDEDYQIDMKCQPLLEIHNPMERSKLNGGALVVDVHYFDLVRLILNFGVINDGYDDLRDNAILINDNYDQDIQYIFDYDVIEEQQYSQNHDKLIESGENGSILVLNSKDVNTFRNQIFLNTSKITPPSADYVHGLNQYINSWTRDFEYDEKLTNLAPEELLKSLIVSNDDKYLHKILTNIQLMISSGVIDDQLEMPWLELLFVVDPPSSYEENMSKYNLITPVVRVKWFEILLVYQPFRARMVFNEMFMNYDHRLQLIWHLCHDINLSIKLIDFIYQLLTDGSFSLEFSRQGDYLELTKNEKDQLIYEFIEGASEFLSVEDGVDFDQNLELLLSPSTVSKDVSLLCLFLETLLQKSILGIHSPHVLQVVSTFLVRFMTKAKVARRLCFKVKDLIQQARISDPAPTKEAISNKLLLQGQDYESFYADVKLTVEKLRLFMNYEAESTKFDVISGIRRFLNMFPDIILEDEFIQRLVEELPAYSLNSEQKKANKSKKK